MSNTSTAVREIQHNSDTNELRVTFRDGATYRYPNVKRSLAQEFAQADSKGRFFNTRMATLYGVGERV